MSAVRHDGGVDSELVGRVARAWGLCDCGWRGEKRTGVNAGFVAFADREGHLAAVGESAMSSGELAVLRAEFDAAERRAS